MIVTIPWWALGCIVGIAAFLGAYLLGQLHGYNAGVRDTEQRWSDAVRSKEHFDAAQLGMEQPWWKERA